VSNQRPDDAQQRGTDQNGDDSDQGGHVDDPTDDLGNEQVVLEKSVDDEEADGGQADRQ